VSDNGMEIIDKILCPKCDAPIKSLVIDDRFTESQNVGEKVVIRERMVMAELPNTQNIRIKMDGGGDHVMTVCKSCSSGLSQNDLEALYAADLVQFGELEKNGGGSVPWYVFEGKKPKGYKLED